MRLIFLAGLTILPAFGGSFEQNIAAIKRIGGEGAGNAEATAAWQELSRVESDHLIAILSAMNSASPIAANYLRSAAEAIVERELKTKQDPHVDGLLAYLADTQNNPRARRLAFELVRKIDADKANPLVPGFLDDSSLELRFDAVAQLISQAQENNGPDSVPAWMKALQHARDLGQIKTITTALKEAGKKIDLQTHFGFLTSWQVIGPFDNSDRKGFARVYPPESAIKLDASYPGKAGEVSWQLLSTENPYGMVDINKPYGELKGVVAYASTTIDAKSAREAQLRLGCKNAWKVWVNGDLIFARDEYHRGMRMDQYHLPVSLKQGANRVLIKLCQDEQTKPWTKEWQFQMRLCDEFGAAIRP
jgi:hypothetical protein